MKIINIDDLLKELDKYKFKQFHIHHTWKPTHKGFKGSNHISMQQAMKNHHMNVNGWSDIGQHISLFPDGKFITGRPFYIQPASIKGWNGNKPLMLEMIGNFDIPGTGVFNDQGYDKLEGIQRENLLKLIKYFIERYGQDSIKFHREGPGVVKSCPGTSLNKLELIREAINLDKKVEVAQMEDKNKPSDWAKDFWSWAEEKGYLDGTRPKDNITREELAIVIRRIVEG